jgi:hemolysin activation/secretion protein
MTALLLSVAAPLAAPLLAQEEPKSESARGTDAPAPAPEPRFDVLEYRVEGNSVLSQEAVERAVYPHLGGGKTLADVERARAALEKAYRDAGYATVSVEIPEQRVANGVVRLLVTEGTLSKVRVKGSRYFLPSQIRAELPALAPGAVLHMPALQEQLAALNRESADRLVTPVFRAGETPGTVELDLRVRDELPLHASLEANNRSSVNTEPLRANAMVRYDNLWQRGHSLSAQYQTAPQETEQVRTASLNYLFKTNAARDFVVFYGVRSNSNVAAVGDITVIGDGDILGARWIHSLRADPRFEDSLSFGFDSKHFGENVVLTDAGEIETPIRYYPLSLGYTGIRPDANGTTSFAATLNFSTRNLSDRDVDCAGQTTDQFECKRFGAKANYLYLKAEYSRLQRFASGWSVLGRLDGQFTSQPLINNEQFAAGGVDSVRGYLEAEQLGDKGLHASVELRTRPYAPVGWGEIHGLAFVEGASLRIVEALPEEDTAHRLFGAGLGARFSAGRHLHGELHWARAFQDAVETKDGDDRFHFSLVYGF